MPKTSKAVYTAHIIVAVEPQMKTQVEAAAAARGVKPSVITRWALGAWLEEYTAPVVAENGEAS